MNRVTLGMMIGVVLIATTLGVSATETSSTLSDINQIKDPYEQCLAYVKMKGLTNVDCKAKVAAMRQNQGPKREERKDDQMMRGTGMLSQSGTMGPRPPRPPMGSGAMMEKEIKGLGLAMGKLKGDERIELMIMIRTYLESKGINLPTPETMKNNNKKVEIEKKAEQEAIQSIIKALKEKDKQKEYTGHVTLMK